MTTRAKTLGAAAAGEGLPAEERRRAAALAERLSVAILARAWQMLLKGLEEIAGAPNQAAAAEMVLIRLAFTADLPAPADIIDALGGAPTRRQQTGGNGQEPRSDRRSATPVDAPSNPPADEDDLSDDDVGPARASRQPPCRSCAPSPTWSPLPASGARPSSRCIWKST